MILTTALEPFYNDLCDVVRLFYGDALMAGASDGIVIRHEADGWKDRFVLLERDVETARHEADAPELGGTALEVTRLRKRACKTALYELLKRHTGKSLPWGSLTGIRPTRLYAEAFARLGGEEAAMAYLGETFDVLPDKARLLRDIAREQAAVPPAAPDEADVYVGIPFCPTRCSYCAFAAEPMSRAAHWVEPYLMALEREIRLGSEDLRAFGMKARAVYIGGGTPTTLTAEQIARLIALLRQCFPDASEWTVEAGRPDTMDAARLDAIAGGGVRRISVNPQTMKNASLRAIGRAHSAEDIETAMALAAKYPFDVINMDIIAGLPGEDAGDVRYTVERVLEMGANNVTVHTLALKRASELRSGGSAVLPSESVAQQMVNAAAAMLYGAGYRPYYLYRQKYMAGNLENVGYAKPGKACVYNIDNMEETAPVLAFGAGAITKWLYPRERRIERATNVRNIEQYIARVQEMAQRKRALWSANT